MVRCKFNGVAWDTNEGKNPSCVYIDDKNDIDYFERELELIHLASKVIEDEWDEKGRPRVKYVYMDAGDWKNRFQANLLINDIEILAARESRKSYWLKVNGKPVEFPRVIFVLQDRDYWPGSETDPLVLKRRLWKEAAYLEKTKSGELSFPRPDRMVMSFDLDEDLIYAGNQYDRDISEYGRAKRRFDLIYNPKLPGSKFVYDNLDEEQRNELQELMTRLFGQLDIDNKLEEGSFSGETKLLKASNNDIQIEELEAFLRLKSSNSDFQIEELEDFLGSDSSNIDTNLEKMEDFQGSDSSNIDTKMEKMEDFQGKMVEEGEADADEMKSRCDAKLSNISNQKMGKMEECKVDAVWWRCLGYY